MPAVFGGIQTHKSAPRVNSYPVHLAVGGAVDVDLSPHVGRSRLHSVPPAPECPGLFRSRISLSASPCNGTDLQGEADQLRELNPVHIDPAVLHDQPESDRRGGVC